MTKAKEKTAAGAYDPLTGQYLGVRTDDDAVLGQFVQIISGEFEGRIGSYEQTLTFDPKTGFPVTILVRTRDARAELLTVDYADARPTVVLDGGRVAPETPDGG